MNEEKFITYLDNLDLKYIEAESYEHDSTRRSDTIFTFIINGLPTGCENEIDFWVKKTTILAPFPHSFSCFFIKIKAKLLPVSEKVFTFIIDKYVKDKIPEKYTQKELEKTYSSIKKTLDILNKIKK